MKADTKPGRKTRNCLNGKRDGKPRGDDSAKGCISRVALLDVVTNNPICPRVKHDLLVFRELFPPEKKRLLSFSFVEPLSCLGLGEKEENEGLLFPSQEE